MDREKVVAWLTEISLRPCDFTTDDFDAYETEHLANEALEICEDAKVFNKQRNDALALLKEQDHKDKMFHALEDDWKQLKKLLKEQDDEIKELRSMVEFWKEKALHT